MCLCSNKLETRFANPTQTDEDEEYVIEGAKDDPALGSEYSLIRSGLYVYIMRRFETENGRAFYRVHERIYMPLTDLLKTHEEQVARAANYKASKS